MARKKVKVEDRQYFDIDTKIRISNKSNFRCCRCGASMGLSKCTIDHIIPLSKGGTNEDKNLLVLCRDCNQEKADLLMSSDEYYKYLEEEYKDEVVDLFMNFYKSSNWLSYKRMFPSDLFMVKIPIFMGRVHLAHLKKGAKWTPSAFRKIKIELVTYNMMQDVYDFVCDARPSISRGIVKKYLSLVFERGALYVARNSQDKISAVFPFKFLVNEDQEVACLCIAPGLWKGKSINLMTVYDELVDTLHGLLRCIDFYIPVVCHNADNVEFLNENNDIEKALYLYNVDDFMSAIFDEDSDDLSAGRNMYRYKECYNFLKNG